MRRLSPKELTNGLFVQCSQNMIDCYDTIYQIIVRGDNLYYRVKDSSWEECANRVMDVWVETPKTIQLNRSVKLDQMELD